MGKQRSKVTRRHVLIYSVALLCILGSLVFVQMNHAFYERPIGKVIALVSEENMLVVDRYGNEDDVTLQQMNAELKNGDDKGRIVSIKSQYAASRAYDQSYRVGDEVFLVLERNSSGEDMLKGSITNVKRDKYLLLMVWVFVLVLFFIGKRQGLLASVSLLINMLILSYGLDLYVQKQVNLLWLSGLLVIVFTIISLLLVNGCNQKTYAAIIATLLGTFFAVGVTAIVMWFTDGRGLYYEEMQYLTRPYRTVFLAGLFIGSLGAVMDVAISMASALFELDDKNDALTFAELQASGRDIGRDIMGTMTNILFFAYVSGSIPTLILSIKNHSQIGYTLSINLSLELARALAGGIGIVATIPLGLYVTLFFIHRKRVRS